MEKDSPRRMTAQRRIILQELQRDCSHPSADEVYERVRKHLPRISLGTVYRNLETLSEQGEILKLEFGGTVKRFDGRNDEHYHIRCTCCDRVDDAPVEPIRGIDRTLDHSTDYRIIGHRLEFIGLCPECARDMISPGLKKSKSMMKKN